MMRSTTAAMLAGACLFCLAQPALAVDSGLEFQVNPIGPGGGELLMYPGGQYLRVVPSLRHPAEAPVPRGTSVRAAPRPASTSAPVAEAPRPAPPPRVASAAPPPRPQPAPPPATPAPAPGANDPLSGLPTISMAPAPGAAPNAASAPAATTAPGTAGLAKQGVILFAKDSSEPAATALESIRYLAGTLNNAMTRPQSRVELMAYGGNKGDKGSDARRLSLRRALAIRQVLIDAGVSSSRINVHAEGGVDDTGPADRVDVFVRA
jgi:outer membrane protein OmpA-like peptidoglycan-associated protein